MDLDDLTIREALAAIYVNDFDCDCDDSGTVQHVMPDDGDDLDGERFDTDEF